VSSDFHDFEHFVGLLGAFGCLTSPCSPAEDVGKAASQLPEAELARSLQTLTVFQHYNGKDAPVAMTLWLDYSLSRIMVQKQGSSTLLFSFLVFSAFAIAVR
jgi:hypothetical protein